MKRFIRNGLLLLFVMAACQVFAVGTGDRQALADGDGTKYEAVHMPRSYVVRTAERGEVWSGEVPILEYHAFSNEQERNVWYVTADAFEQQLRYLQEEGYTSVSFEELANFWYERRSLPPKPVLISIDDGYRDNYTIAYPLLKKYKMKATIFLTANMVEADDIHLGWDEIKEMQESGLVSFQAHGVSHRNLVQLSEEEARREIVDAKQVLEEHLKQEVIAFSYPGGYNNAGIRDMVEAAGYLLAVVAKGNYASMSQGVYELNRIIVSGLEKPLQFVNYLK